VSQPNCMCAQNCYLCNNIFSVHGVALFPTVLCSRNILNMQWCQEHAHKLVELLHINVAFTNNVLEQY
jgi:hypothetical protein